MLLKCMPDGRRIKVSSSTGKGGLNVSRGAGMKLTTATTSMMTPRVHRKGIKVPHKRTYSEKMSHFGGKLAHLGGKAHPITKYGSKLAHYAKLYSGKPHSSKGKMLQHYPRTMLDPCDSSNDSGLGIDQHMDPLRMSTIRFSEQPETQWCNNESENKNRMDIKIESDDAIDNFTFPEPRNSTMLETSNPETALATSTTNERRTPNSGKFFGNYRQNGKLIGSKIGSKLNNSGKFSGKTGNSSGLTNTLMRRRPATTSGQPTFTSQFSNVSRDGSVQLVIICQPESQHRARYQTEGSRGAVKDNSGNGFPVVKLVGYNKPATLQVFIGTDTGRIAPHMFYQACRVSGKNSTPCSEKKEDGTVLIEIDLEPTKNWQVTCDCVGILKERNVDVEHRFGEQLSSATTSARGKKKSTRCRMVFRTKIQHDDGTYETLQACSNQIICTQPPGVPEICKKSLVSCNANGGLELFILGKNFLKDSRVVFSQRVDGQVVWEETVIPEKDFLQQNHLVCRVPTYGQPNITEAVCVWVCVRAGGRLSDPSPFTYTPVALDCGPQHASSVNGLEEAKPVLLWGGSNNMNMMPPPAPRRPSIIVPDSLKTELQDDSSQHSQRSDGDTNSPRELKVDLDPETEYKLSPSSSENLEKPSPLASFTQQLQAMQSQVHTDKMMESVAAVIFNSDDNTNPMNTMYSNPPILQPMPSINNMQTLMSAESHVNTIQRIEPITTELMLNNSIPQAPLTCTLEAQSDPRLLGYNTGIPMSISSSGSIESLVSESMTVNNQLDSAAKLDELVNSTVGSINVSASSTDSLLPSSKPTNLTQNLLLEQQVSSNLMCESSSHIVSPSTHSDIMMISNDSMHVQSTVKTPPAAVKSMILNAAAEILTSDSTMNALVTSAITTASILTTEQVSPAPEAPIDAPHSDCAAMSQAVSQAVTQAVSQAVSHAVSQAVNQELKAPSSTAPIQELTDMSDSDLLSYINPSCFDQV